MVQYGYDSMVNNFPVDPELDLRTAFHNTIYGTDTELPRGRLVVIQRLVRDKNGDPIKSPSAYKTTGEGQNANRGYATTRTGYLCNEVMIRALVKPAGRLVMDEIGAPMGEFATDRVVFYTSYKHPLNNHDVAILPVIDDDGNIVNPVTIAKEYNLTVPYDRTLDSGRVEFHVCIGEVQK